MSEDLFPNSPTRTLGDGSGSQELDHENVKENMEVDQGLPEESTTPSGGNTEKVPTPVEPSGSGQGVPEHQSLPLEGKILV